jgi:hypothetical protein
LRHEARKVSRKQCQALLDVVLMLHRRLVVKKKSVSARKKRSVSVKNAKNVIDVASKERRPNVLRKSACVKQRRPSAKQQRPGVQPKRSGTVGTKLAKKLVARNRLGPRKRLGLNVPGRRNSGELRKRSAAVDVRNAKTENGSN